ncbi:kelch domain-containing protein 1-like isoform X2 [Puntigrus tetrazona]|uniref:kelch domain-containing protein 1-like isoform X2 n=1 Tax=Puntigrus tetrazona TaxID=1606681 RepID=UPI001C896405|nr:kelch domain-containing protein 1-like isoform X2 [Puntigrus tetrazona]
MQCIEEPAVTEQRSPVPPRSDHISFLEGNKLYVWGGYQCVDGQETFLPSDEIWLYDMQSGVWSRRYMGGEVPPVLSQACGGYLQGTLYIFGGCDLDSHTNTMYCVDLLSVEYTWKKVTDTVGGTPSPRARHSCWVYKNRLVYFGGYGCKTARESTKPRALWLMRLAGQQSGQMFSSFGVGIMKCICLNQCQPHGLNHKPRGSRIQPLFVCPCPPLLRLLHSLMWWFLIAPNSLQLRLPISGARMNTCVGAILGPDYLVTPFLWGSPWC